MALFSRPISTFRCLADGTWSSADRFYCGSQSPSASPTELSEDVSCCLTVDNAIDAAYADGSPLEVYGEGEPACTEPPAINWI